MRLCHSTTEIVCHWNCIEQCAVGRKGASPGEHFAVYSPLVIHKPYSHPTRTLDPWEMPATIV